VIGRKAEIERVIQILHKKRACNPLLVALPGVGKTAIVEGLAQRIANGEVPKSLKDVKLLSISLGSMIAGTKYRGEFEERLKEVIDAVKNDSDTVLFIDELHTVCGAGSAEGALDASNILKPHLTNGDFRVIGATTYEEYRKNILKDKAFARRFKKIDVGEPSNAETLEILKGLRESYQEFHKIEFSDEMLEKIVELSARHISEQYFPDKAIEVMDEIGSRYRSRLKKGRKCTLEDVEEVVSGIANIPVDKLRNDGKGTVLTLNDELKKEIYGQDEAVEKIVQHLKIARAGLVDKGKPLGVFALVGATGVGKTELVKQVARHMNSEFVRLDMSEYSEKNSVSKLTGTSPGYVGFEQAGALTEPILRNPDSVVLFDEIEKADPSIYNLLLQVMDEGRLTDNNNRVADFTRTVIFMTSNVGSGAEQYARQSIGFDEDNLDDRKMELSMEEMKKHFPPEFRNRFTDIIRFNPLDENSFRMIVDKAIRKLNGMLEDRRIHVWLTEEARNDIARRAMDEHLGGRPVERIVNKDVSEKLVDRMLAGGLSGCDVVFGMSVNEAGARGIDIFTVEKSK